MRPTKDQAHALNRMAGARRWVWNWALRRWKEHYAATGKSIPMAQLSAELTALKQQPETAWLREADSQALQQVLTDLHQAFRTSSRSGRASPKFKSRKRDGADFASPSGSRSLDGKVYVPKIGEVRIRQSQAVAEETKSATFKRAADGKWYVTLVVEFEMPDIPIPAPTRAQTVGIDVGLIDFATISDRGRTDPRPEVLPQGSTQAAQGPTCRVPAQAGRKRRAKAVRKAAAVHQKIADQRGDFLHKLSTKIVGRVCRGVHRGSVALGLARTKLAKSFARCGPRRVLQATGIQVRVEPQTLHRDRSVLSFVQDVHVLWCGQRDAHALGSGVGL